MYASSLITTTGWSYGFVLQRLLIQRPSHCSDCDSGPSDACPAASEPPIEEPLQSYAESDSLASLPHMAGQQDEDTLSVAASGYLFNDDEAGGQEELKGGSPLPLVAGSQSRVPPSEPYITELQRCWPDPKAFLHLPIVGKIDSRIGGHPPGTPLRSLQVWVNGLGLDPKRHQGRMVVVPTRCLQSLKPWKSRAYLSSCVLLGSLPSRREAQGPSGPPSEMCFHQERLHLWAALKGVPLNDICAAAAWASSCTFARFYRVNVAIPHPVAAAVLSVPSSCN
ncbi:hypothetical protein D9C73_013325 [Collichthys lucidus]|uniref:Uncharacterized protein n=1 Tax=Collichthys lucidus TaxID=240159 RepID=A0A4V6AQH6_COLLU|nr:hypothetical protein D9C73_013325 [Collichthys lucidus]